MAAARFVSATVPWPRRDALAFLRSGPGPRLLVEDPDGTVLAGLGTAVALVADGPDRLERLDAQVRDVASWVVGPAPRFLGGFGFADAAPRAPWDGFPSAWLVLPRLLLVVRPEGATLTATVPDDEDPHAAIAALEEAAAGKIRTVKFARSADERERWTSAAADTVAAIRRGEAEKVVVARSVVGEAAAPVDPVAVLAALEAAKGARFLVEPAPGHAFVGATPELLVSVRGRSLRTMAVAGSAARGASPGEQATLADHMLHDPKERHEHALVIDAIWRGLSGLASEIRIGGAPAARAAGPVQHLVTEVAAELDRRVSALAATSALHPTPAVGGTPVAKALALISDAESFERGWYAGGVGWVDADGDGTFLVALRAALILDRAVHAFAGAGLVAASDPAREWDETELKLRTVLDALDA